MRVDDIAPNGPHGPFVALPLQCHEVRHKTLDMIGVPRLPVHGAIEHPGNIFLRHQVRAKARPFVRHQAARKLEISCASDVQGEGNDGCEIIDQRVTACRDDFS